MKPTKQSRRNSAIFAKNKHIKDVKENVKKFDEIIKKNKKDMKYIVWTVVNKNKKINLNRTSFYKDKDFAIAEAELRNQSVVEKDKPYKIKKATLILE